MKASRMKNVYVNASFAVVTRIVMTLMSFIVRKIFIDTLGVEYLGYNSVFTNLLQLLNLADFGVGAAVTSYLYKPLANDDKRQIASLMKLYKKIYEILGLAVLLIGMVITFFIPYIISDSARSPIYLQLLFLINLAGTVSSYYLSYKGTLLIADQKNYIVSISALLSNLLTSVLSLLCLLFFPNYIIYVVISIVLSVLFNFFLAVYTDRHYSYINEQSVPELVGEYKERIWQYVKDVFISKIGAYIYSGTDNVIISIFKGSIQAGFLSNYTVITAALTALIKDVLASIQATFGNYINSTEDRKLQIEMTDNYLCVDFLIANFCMICFYFLVQPFIAMVFGAKYVLPDSTPLWLAVNLLLTIILTLPSQLFVIYRLYHYDRVVVAVSALANILISVILVRKIGVNGVLIGTFVTSIFYLVSRFYIVGRFVFNISFVHYILKFIYYAVVSSVSFIAAKFVLLPIPLNGILYFILRAVIVVIVSVLVPAILVCRTNEFKFVVNKIMPNSARQK